ncbi:MAG: 2-polyprenyl-3-methyl-6-methoxy-1,4-benzoquinone monooxygenase [Gammaproteobacteria bacterium]|nr:2-polyprenyl-3-methyl-6-methoxy-1,4-benzoquinone monooxygenase [Gammaproteobacteria bacterium]
MTLRHYTILDKFIVESDKAIKTVFGKPETSAREIPGNDLGETTLSQQEAKRSIGLMRVNHSGEVSAQALYQGQALTAKLPNVRQAMEQAAIEENDHLVWCEQRVHHFDGHTSLLNPFWYVGSFAIGALAGKIGDKWSLGFVAETEKQVIKHLEQHLDQISKDDLKSRAILQQMKRDEVHHGIVALQAGGAALPPPVKLAMRLVSKIMTMTSYRI